MCKNGVLKLHRCKTKETKGLSYIFLLIGFLASILMIIYGFFINAFPIVIANIIYMICNISLLHRPEFKMRQDY